MGELNLNLVISLEAGPDVPEEILFKYTNQVLQQLKKEEGVNSIRRARWGEKPPGAKGTPCEINMLILALVSTQALISTIFILYDWVQRREHRAVMIKVDLKDRTFEIECSPGTGSSAALIGRIEQFFSLLHDPLLSPVSVTQLYCSQNIRSLLTEGFNADELWNFCHDNPDFKPVYNRLVPGTDKTKIVQYVIEHAEQKLLIGQLLTWAEKQNPARYEKHQPYTLLDITPSSSPKIERH